MPFHPHQRALLLAALAALPSPAHCDGGIWGEAWQASHAEGALEVNTAASERDQAQSIFQTIRSLDLTSPDALGRLERYGLQSGQVNRALKNYARDKTSPYFKQLDTQNQTVPGQGGLSLLQSLREKGTSAQYILSSLAKGNPVSIVQSYFFSLLLDSQGFASEADYFFNKAEFLKSLARSRRLTELARPLQYELPGVYDQLGMPRVSPYQLQILPFLNDTTMQQENFIVENALDTGGRRATAGGFVQFDSNVLQLADSSDLPANIGGNSGVNQIAYGDLGLQTSPVRMLQVGAIAQTFVNHHVRNDLRLDDAWTIAPTVFASAWNGANNELRARYDYLYTLRQEGSPHAFSRIQGPQAGWAHAWNRGAYQAEALYSYKTFTYASDASAANAQSGPEHALTLKLAYPGVSAKAQPYVSYTFTHHWPQGSNFDSNSHVAEAGISYFYGAKLVVNAITQYAIAFYPNSQTDRIDRTRSARIGAIYRLLDYLSLTLDGGYLTDTSSSPELFSYSRWTVMGGLVVGGWM